MSDSAHRHQHHKQYEILVEGRFLEHQVKVKWTSRARTRSNEVERLIDSTWTDRLAQNNGQSLFPGPLCRLVKYSVVKGALILDLGPTDYRELIGTNVYHPEIAECLGHDYLSNALAVHSTIVTSDGRIPVFQRSNRVGEYPGAYDVCGGHIDPSADVRGGAPNPFLTLRRELEEEIAVSSTEIERVVCRGIVRNITTLKPDLIFDVWTNRPWADFEQRGLDEEHRTMLYIRDSRREISRFIREHGENTAPAGIAALELHDAG